MPITWHHDRSPPVAVNRTPASSSGGLRVPAQGRGTYLFYVDHAPHNNHQLTVFAGAPTVRAYTRQGQLLGTKGVRHDKYGDRNAAVWDGSGNPRCAYYVVTYHLHPNSVRVCRPGTGFAAYAKFRRC